MYKYAEQQAILGAMTKIANANGYQLTPQVAEVIAYQHMYSPVLIMKTAGFFGRLMGAPKPMGGGGYMGNLGQIANINQQVPVLARPQGRPVLPNYSTARAQMKYPDNSERTIRARESLDSYMYPDGFRTPPGHYDHMRASKPPLPMGQTLPMRQTQPVGQPPRGLFGGLFRR